MYKAGVALKASLQEGPLRIHFPTTDILKKKRGIYVMAVELSRLL